MKLLTALRVSALAAILFATLAFVACDGGDGPDPDPTPTDNNTAASMTARINDFRTDSGGVAFDIDSTLSDLAQEQAEFNAQNSTNGDTNGDGENMGEQLTEAGYDYQTYALMFNNLGESASFADWQDNPAYTSIMLDPTLTDIGVGTAQVGSGLRRWVVIFASEDVPTNGTVQQMLALLNEYRTEHGQPEFTINDNLAIVAQAQAEYNASIQANESTTGSDSLQEQVETTGYTYGTLLWTLANGGPESSLDIWTDTPTEASNMQNANLTDIGIGVASGGTQQWWVVLYADPQP